MVNPSILRKVMLIAVMLMFLAALSFNSSTKSAIANGATTANACSVCRMACFKDYRQCINSGQLGCDIVLSDCVASCPCP